ncbi:aminopeptidase N [Kushneria phosphatilytica]|uniref:Aminopeptidase N n=1 Tax=Kushneria phosphatilytica TaxID=657387 RepID=A0A5C0ZY05_9GAMM|nr:aminopeptidase N [Kushneria phosphatilytica]QEL10754.1 aminopeptidase N [Kushneria phosphatilytica]
MSEPQAIYLSDYQPPAYQVTRTELTFELDPHATRVRARLHLERHEDQGQGEALVLNGEHLTTLELAIDGQTLKDDEYRIENERLTIFRVPERFVLDTEVEIDPAANTALEGLYVSGSMFCTQCEPEGFRRITWYPDRPDVMATFETTIIGDREQLPVMLSNGNPVEWGELPDGRHFVTWQDPHPKPSYLFALVAGELEKLEDRFTTMSGREVTLQLWVEARNTDKTEWAMESLKRAMRWDEQAYGREYDLDRFMIVAVDDFNMGAMENKGLNIFNSAAVLANPATTTDAAFQRIDTIVAHEYFHNWSGNRVTCRDWFQLALKEGFTVFRDQSYTEDTQSAAVARIQNVAMLRTAQFAEDAGPTAHPVRPDHFIEISNFYTLTIYEKGAEVVRMLRNLVGPETFRRGSDRYFERFDGQAVRVEDFVATMAEVSGLDLDQFMRWYSQAGTPQLSVQGEYDATARQYHLTIAQHTPATPGQPDKQPLHIPVRMGLLGPDGASLELVVNGESHGTDTVLALQQERQSWTFEQLDVAPVPSLLRGFSAPVQLDYNWSRDDLALLMRFDEDGFNRWDGGQRLALAALEDMMVAWRANESMKLDGRLIEAWRGLLNSPTDDRAVLAEMLRLPTEAWIAEQQSVVDVDAIHAAREAAISQLADNLYVDFERTYHANQLDAPYAPTPEQIAARSLKNVALGYMVATGEREPLMLAQAQFEADHNMTDVRAALTLLAHSDASELGDPAIRAFGERWAHDPLVMDQWFATQVTRPQQDVMERLKFLMEHQAFSLKNPNRVRALIGTFVNSNRVNFHRIDGEGYRLLADVVIELNQLNPEIAARMVTPLTRFRRFDEQRQRLMRAELERIRQEPLSRNLYEVVAKALAD